MLYFLIIICSPRVLVDSSLGPYIATAARPTELEPFNIHSLFPRFNLAGKLLCVDGRSGREGNIGCIAGGVVAGGVCMGGVVVDVGIFVLVVCAKASAVTIIEKKDIIKKDKILYLLVLCLLVI